MLNNDEQMKIVKSNSREIYDTDDGGVKHVPGPVSLVGLVPLHHRHRESDFEFLSRFFPEGHPVFNDFSNSYYWVAEQEEIIV